MKVRIQGLVAAGAFAIYAALGAAAFAQPTPGMAGMSPPRDDRITPRTAIPAGRAERLRDILQLSPAQEPALQTYVAALEQSRRSTTGAMGDTAGPMPRTTPERLARMQQMMAERQDAMTAAMDATRQFYDQLDPGQKRAFDALPVMPGGMMRGGGGGAAMPPPPPPTGF